MIDHNDPRFHPVTPLQWAKVLCEIVKKEEFSEFQKCYAPTPFVGNSDNNVLEFCKAVNKHREKVMLEVTLQPYTKSQEIQGFLQSATEKYTERYANLPHYDRDRAHELKRAIDNHKQHLYLFEQSNQIPFQFAIKLFTESDIPTHHLITTLTQTALKNSTHHFIRIDHTDPLFQPSRLASESIEILPILEHIDWQKNYLNETIQSRGNNKNSIRDFDIPNTEPITNTQLKSVSELKNDISISGSLSNPRNSGGSPLTEFYKSLNLSHPYAPQSVKPIDLKPLHRLAFPQEIAGFFRIVIAKEEDAIGLPFEKPKSPKRSAEDIFYSHKHLITKDKYIVGINEQGQIVSSDWNESPHRLIAGVTRCGKTNFLHWLIFQFLYADPERKVYILDLKENNFRFYKTQLPEQVRKRVVVAKEIRECYDLLKKVYQEYERRKDIIGDYQTIQEMVDNGGEYTPRLLLIVDEAALIPEKSKELKSTIPPLEQGKNPEIANLQVNIDRYLQYFATTGAGFNIHLMYCTQNPRSDVITTQVTSQLEERLIFRITSDTSAGIIGEQLHSRGVKIPEGKDGKGKVYMKGVEGSQYVYTPLIAVPPATAIAQTLWNLL